MKNFIKVGELDLSSALAELQSDMWKEDTFLRKYPQGPFGDTTSVILRFPTIAVDEKTVITDEHENVWTDISRSLPILRGLVFDLAYDVKATRIGRVLVNKLKPGGRIFKHADTPVHANYWSRFHFVLQAKEGVEFHCEDEVVNMRTGEIWFFRNELVHEVINNTDEERIHFVVDLKTELK